MFKHRKMITVVIVLVVGAVLFLLSRSNSYLVMDRKGFRTRVMTPSPIFVSQLPAVFSQLKSNHKNASWAAFTFCPQGEPANDEAAVNLQYSVENGAIGLDWVLLAPRNKADKDKIVAFIKEQNYTILEREGNGVHYLRVEDGDLVQLGDKIVKSLYGLRDENELAMFTDRFEWHP
jgi:hypothetical protein